MEAQLLGEGAAVAGRLDVAGGGVAFLPTGPRGGFAISTRGLRRVGPAAPGSADVAIEGDGVRYVLRIDPVGAAAFVDALERERRAAEAPHIPLGTPVPPEVPRTGDDDLAAPGPTPVERAALAPDSLPGLWLRLTTGADRRRTRQTDGMSMLLELALCGALDAPTREMLVVHLRPSGDAAVGGALRRLMGRAVLADPRRAPWWLGPYVARLHADASHAQAVRAEARAAMVDAPAYPRAALLVWLVKQDYEFRRVAFPLIFEDDARRGRRLVRRSPDIHVGDDPAATMRAHRVLAAVAV